MGKVNIVWNDMMIIGMQMRVVDIDHLPMDEYFTQTDEFPTEPIAVLNLVRKTYENLRKGFDR